MEETRVLIITGGIVSPRDTAISKLLKKQLTQWKVSQNHWLEIKIKAIIAESVFVGELEKKRTLQTSPNKNLRQFLNSQINFDTPDLTEVSLATLLRKEGIKYEVATYDDLFVGSSALIGSHFIKKGQRVFPCIYMAQHDPENFSDPSSFKPERFFGRKEMGFRWSYFPFGLGDRVCLGKNLGLIQAQVLAEIFVHKIHGELVDKKFTPVRKNVLIVPKDGTNFRVQNILSQPLVLTPDRPSSTNL